MCILGLKGNVLGIGPNPYLRPEETLTLPIPISPLLLKVTL